MSSPWRIMKTKLMARYSGTLVNRYKRLLNVNRPLLAMQTVRKLMSMCVRLASSSSSSLPNVNIPHFISSDNDEAIKVAVKDMSIYEDFITKEEEESMLRELEPYIKRLRYESSHWDDAIHGYRETEKAKWNSENKAIIDRVRNLAFEREDNQLRHVHVLDISADGYIKAHIDSIKFCGDTIAGISLLSSSVMRLVHDEHKEQSFDVLLKQRSLYIMKGEVRYKYTHEILPEQLSNFKSVHVPRQRRISVICRNAPPDTDT